MRKKKAKMSYDFHRAKSAESAKNDLTDFLREAVGSSRETISKFVSEELPKTRELIESVTKRT